MRQQIKLVMMDPDYGYLKTLEKQVILQFADRADIQFITESAYREQYFSSMRNIDLLVTAQEYYGEYLKKHSIAHTIVLRREEESLMEIEKPVDLPEDFEVTVNLDELMAEDHASGDKPVAAIPEEETPSGFYLEESIIAQLDAAADSEAREEIIAGLEESAEESVQAETEERLETEEAAAAHSEAVSAEGEPSADLTEAVEYNENCIVLSKFSTTREIIDTMEKLLAADQTEKEVQVPLNKKPLKVISVYSPIGGCGKSLIALGLARKLRKLDQSVLIIGCDEMQSISGFLESEESAEPVLAEVLRQSGADIYWNILQNVEYEGDVRYLLPFEKPLSAMGIEAPELELMVKTIKEKQDFDYVVLDLGSSLNTAACSLMHLSDCLVLVTEPNAVSVKKMKKLVNNAALLPDCRCFMIANQHHLDGLRLSSQNIFGHLASYQDPDQALEDPVFYQIALEVLE
ncbi:MAG: AAA family ATPase [Lachnospiraceae bacterium]|nr:AAA family ATPase [Lachnospiraceae bacterium]